MSTCADLLTKVDAYAAVEADLTARDLMTAPIADALALAKADLGDEVAAAIAADTAPGGVIPEAITFGPNVYTIHTPEGGKPHLDLVVVKDAAAVPIPAPPAPEPPAEPAPPAPEVPA